MDWTTRPPREVATWILTRLFAEDTAPSPDRAFPLAPFQEVAVARARRILDRRGGMVVADAVGLGKTYVALALIEDELARGSEVLVAIPAALRPQWRGPLRRLRTGSRSGGVHLLSHAQLSRGSYPAGLGARLGLVVVDEAHRFRNARTRRHAALADLCAAARVVLLTATPVNNGPRDLHTLLRLFARDDAFLDMGVPSLRELLAPSGAAADGGSETGGSTTDGGATGHAGPALRRVLGEVLVRRTRAMVRDEEDTLVAAGTPVRFPCRAPLAIVRYDDGRVARLAPTIGALELAAYRLPTGAGDDAGNAVALVRLGLLKRLESGAAPLGRSVRRQLGFCRSFLAALDAGRLLRPHRPGPRTGAGDRDPLQLVLVDLVAEPWPTGLDAVAIRSSVQRDIDRLTGIRSALTGPDPKLDALATTVADLAPEKIIVFSEFRDTAEAIWRALTPFTPVGRIDGGGAWLGRRPAGRGAVVERFAPRANGAADPPLRERVDVLVATDVLAEGVNLQDARHVISYDLPWNPVRLMQRIGRVDRLGSPHDLVVPHLFLPAAGLEDMLGLMRRLRSKLGAIADTVGGEDAIGLLERLGTGDAEAAARAMERIEILGQDPMERLRASWHRLAARSGSDGSLAEGIPSRGRVPVGGVCAPGGEDAGDTPAAVVLVRERGRPRLVEIYGHGRPGAAREAGAGAARLLQAALDSGPDDRAPTSLQPARLAADMALAYMSDIAAAGRAPSPIRAAEPTARIARALRSSLATTGAWARPATIARADRLLQRLAVPLPAGLASEAARLLEALESVGPPEAVLDRVEELLDRCPCAAPTGSVDPAPARSAPPPTRTPDRAVLAVLMTIARDRADRASRG